MGTYDIEATIVASNAKVKQNLKLNSNLKQMSVYITDEAALISRRNNN